MSQPQREARVIDMCGTPGASNLDKLLVASPEALWRAWIEKIVTDPEMSTDRILRHLQEHVQSHIPDADAANERWEEWLAGTYNLLAILSTALGISPPFTLGSELLLRKWLSAPSDHTPPPAAVRPEQVPTTRRARPRRPEPPIQDYSGS
jgi:hypothetical protein